MKHKTTDYIEYQQRFYDYINSGKEIRTRDEKETLILNDDEKWKQCFNPDDEIRKSLPPYWFISESGEIISMQSGKAKWLKKDHDNGRYSYHFVIHQSDGSFKKKNIELHNLIGIVFGSGVYGKANERLRESGLDAFGVKNNSIVTLNGHHKDGKKENNNPENIRLLTSSAHILTERVPKNPTDTEKVFSFMEDLSCVAVGEAPNNITILLTGQKINPNTIEVTDDSGYRDIQSINQIALTPNAYKSLVTLYDKAMSGGIVERCVEQLTKQFGVEWFENEDRYFITSYGDIYKCINENESVLRIIEIFDTIELVNKSIINCYINDKKQAECYIS